MNPADLPVREELAFYYPSAYWYEGETSDWIKTLLLFFDGVATLVPYSMRTRMADADPAVAGYLVELGLLRPLDAEEALEPWRHEEDIAAKVESYLDALLPDLQNEPLEILDAPHVLAVSKIPFKTRRYLKERGLARSVTSENITSELMVPRSVWRVVLTALAQFVSEKDRHNIGADLLPVTDQLDCVHFLQSHVQALRGAVVATDLGLMNIDLSAVPIDEVLDFRTRYGMEFRAYRRNLNRYMLALSSASFDQRLIMERDRTEELRDMRSKLEQEARPFGRLLRNAPFFLGITGAGVQVGAGDFLGGSGSAVAATGALFNKQPAQGEYTYLFRAAYHFPQRNDARR